MICPVCTSLLSRVQAIQCRLWGSDIPNFESSR
uniref:Uncharacterized protein n=1 Tax=Parascaris equorum TaxID=6256 RepID=A0A914RCG1_PAREQ